MKTGVQRTYNYLKGLDSGFRRNDRKAYSQTFYEIIIFDGLVKSQNWDGKVKISICKARNPAQSGTEEVYLQVRRNDEGEAQRRRWTFYEAIIF